MANLNNPVTFTFDDDNKAAQSREQLTFRLIDFWGVKKVLFTRNWDGWIAMVKAIRAVSDIHQKRAGLTQQA